MIRHVRFDKKKRVVDELIRRIEGGVMADGFLLPGEHQLAEEFAVSRGTLREALSELKRRNYIATQSGVGSIVTFDGMVLACSFFVATPFVIICSILGALVMNLTLAINHRNDRYIAM